MRDDEYLSMVKSTIVRSGIRPIPGARAVGATLSALAPALAARLAARLFLTPQRHRRPEPEICALSTARPRAIEMGGRRVQTWAWGAGPAVLLMHGWAGRGAQLAAFVEPLLARGFSVVTFDAPGHGDSEGRQATLPDLAATLRTVAAIHGPVHGVIAHSLGAAATARAVHEGLTAGALVFLGAPADLVTPSLVFAEALGLSRRVRELMRQRVEQRVGVPWEAFDVTRLAPCQTAPLLVVHDRGDAEVPWQHGAAIAAAWPGAKLITTDGLGHRRILRDPTVLAAAVSFTARRSAEAAALTRAAGVRAEPAAALAS
jgi:pimeloyl-ACP methyl ester carboxylesterase